MSQASIPNRYSDVIKRVKYQIRQKVWLPGERVPSIRKMSRMASVSPATVTKAYELLEVEGWIYAKPQSGYYVAAHFNQLEPSSPSGPPQVSNQAISINRHVFDVLKAIKQPDVIPFGSAFPDPALFPVDELGRRLSRVIKSMPLNSGVTDLPPGCLELRRVIAQRYANEGLSVSADDIVITTGATEALGVSLAAVTQPGDTVVIESPAFYGALQAIERLHLKAIELPLGDGGGVDIDALANIVEQHDVKACWFMSKFQNPSATTMTVEQLTLIYQLLAAKQIPLIEDDVYSELYFGSDKPPSFKSIDEHGLVLHCSSFSKCLAPGFRVGWVLAGRFSKQVEELQFMSTLSVAVPNQQTLAAFVKAGGYDNHLRQLRRVLETRVSATMTAIQNDFPVGTRVTMPEGGYFLWVTLPIEIDTSELLEQLLGQHRISVAPGTLFSSSRQFKHCMRLNASFELNDEKREALKQLGKVLHRAQKGCGR